MQTSYYAGSLYSTVWLQMSDLLENHSLALATDYSGGSQEVDSDLNFIFAYDYYGRRPTWRMRLFNWSQFYNDRDLTLNRGRLVRGVTRSRQSGLLVDVGYPFDLYRRMELSYTFAGEEQERAWPVRERLAQSSVHLVKMAYVHDSILYGPVGPSGGKRYFLAAGRALDLTADSRSFSHVEVDYRRYLRLGRGSVLGLRWTGVGSLGPDGLEYLLGGPAWFQPFYTGFNLNIGPLRGYDFSEFIGRRVVLANAEWRVPLIRQIVFGWPVTFAIPAVDGSLFIDAGMAWNQGDELIWWPLHIPRTPEPEGEKHLRASAGFGLLVPFMLPLNFEFARQTDLQGNWSDYRVHFSFGRSF